ncbi:helix-turn-helix domain-containing protein [Paenibacillus sp. FSL R7-0331]|uniref:helix-turn-helix domain-containing protein n=1 Tax=Paenibacillus sp. FSL R7-0331 TaxID=1536773 RepID=UPI0004F7BDC4|nr:helix-turn-helix domain-containing protein [Paenibacillus sp. FSL R7-0331]AIQ55451.1 hypothetical protein R70331_30885 [Paenibacillus sp. FSL R7-0331]
MLDQVRFGNEISYLRKKRGLTQNMLANKLCTQALISKIEQGQVLPGIDILYELSIRLKVPLTSLIKKLIYERQDYYDLLFYDLDLLLYNKSYDEIITICKSELNRKMLPKIRQNFCRFYTLAQYYLKKLTAEETLKKLSEMIESNIFYHHYMEDVLHNDIANIYVDQGSYFTAQSQFEEILAEQKECLEFNAFKSKVYYDQADAFYRENKYKNTLETINMGIQHSVNMHYMMYMSDFYKLRAKVLENNINNREIHDISKAMSNIFCSLYCPYDSSDAPLQYIKVIRSQKVHS